MTLFFFVLLFLVIDFYFYQGIIAATKGLSPAWKNTVRAGFWVPTLLSFAGLLYLVFAGAWTLSGTTRNFIISGLFATYFSKTIGLVFLLSNDIYRAGRWVVGLFTREPGEKLSGEIIPRSQFLSQVAVGLTALPVGAMAYGIISGAHDYRIRRVTVNLPNLPKSFDGIRIGQVSDIHSGSFWNKTAVQGGVEMLMKEKTDMVFFTGDLVNTHATEVKDYLPIFGKVKAPLGVFSITGNHDYGDYGRWESEEAKKKNFGMLMDAHKAMGYDLLMNENRIIEQGGEKIAILGNENWGVRFSKYGKLDEAYKGSEEAAVKLLLSHDPTHWDAEVRPKYPDIDMMFAGHTHGFQFGVEIGDFRWSPVKYVYRQWADLHQEGNQYLYVNRGFGYIGYPGRVGILPEITVFELKRGS